MKRLLESWEQVKNHNETFTQGTWSQYIKSV